MGAWGITQNLLPTPRLGWLLPGHGHPSKQCVRWDSAQLGDGDCKGPCSCIAFLEGHECAAGKDIVAALSSFRPLAPHFVMGFFCIYFSKCLFHSSPVADNWELLLLADLGTPLVLIQTIKSGCKSGPTAGSTPDVQSKSWHPLQVVGLN